MKTFFKLALLIFFLGGSFQGMTQTTAQDTTVVAEPDVPATFRGGLEKWSAFLTKELNRDLLVKQNAPIGIYRVIVSFIVEKDGKLRDIEIEYCEGKEFGTDKEVKRVMNLSSKKWLPATVAGEPVNYRHRQSISFMVSY